GSDRHHPSLARPLRIPARPRLRPFPLHLLLPHLRHLQHHHRPPRRCRPRRLPLGGPPHPLRPGDDRALHVDRPVLLRRPIPLHHPPRAPRPRPPRRAGGRDRRRVLSALPFHHQLPAAAAQRHLRPRLQPPL